MYPKPTMAPKEVRSMNQFRVFRPRNASTMEITMIKKILKLVRENRSERMRSSAIVERILVAARYPPMIPVRMPESAATTMTARPAVPMMRPAAKKVGTEVRPVSPSREETYSCHEENPSGTADTAVSVMDT